MTATGHRRERVAEEIRNEVTLMLAGELKDPRLATGVDVTEVRVMAGIKQVRVFVHVVGTREDRAETLKGLAAAAGFIRHELAERLQLRRVPEMFFHLDETEEYSQHINQLLEQVKPPKES